MKPLSEKRSIRNNLFGIALALAVITGVSLTYNLLHLRDYYEDIALMTGRSFFQSVLVTRRWNAEHGGVYVPVTPTTQPNPYLDDPLRNATTTGGMKLTKINPAFMTRMISQIAGKERGVQIHITSLKPINPANKPDAWEEKALRSFEQNTAETFAIEDRNGSTVFRYMAPLKTEQACLKCHAGQGYRLGDVRGGIEISFPYESYQKAMAANQGQMITLHLAFLAVSLSLLGILGKTLAANAARLEAALVHIRDLEGILPVCSSCKKIRTERHDAAGQKQWVSLEDYVLDKSTMKFSHGICPDCVRQLYPDYAEKTGKTETGEKRK